MVAIRSEMIEGNARLEGTNLYVHIGVNNNMVLMVLLAVNIPKLKLKRSVLISQRVQTLQFIDTCVGLPSSGTTTRLAISAVRLM